MSNEFEVMKGFLGDFVEKGSGTSPETLPPDAKGDEYLGEHLDEKGNSKKGKRGNVGGGTPMNDTLDDIASAAASDIDSGYVQDVQTGKGFNLYNEMVAKGALIDNLTIKKYEVGSSLREITDSFGLETKGPKAKTVKAAAKAGGGILNAVADVAKTSVEKVGEAAKYIGGKAVEGSKTVGSGAKYIGGKAVEGGKAVGRGAVTTGKYVKENAVPLGVGAGVGTGVGAGAYYSATKDKKEKGFIELETKGLPSLRGKNIATVGKKVVKVSAPAKKVVEPSNLEKIGQGVSGIASDLGSRISGGASKVGEAITSGGKRVGETISAGAGKVGEGARYGAEKAKQAGQWAWRNKVPLGIGLGAGSLTAGNVSHAVSDRELRGLDEGIETKGKEEG